MRFILRREQIIMLIVTPKVYEYLTTPITKKSRTWEQLKIKREHNEWVRLYWEMQEPKEENTLQWGEAIQIQPNIEYVWDFAWYKIYTKHKNKHLDTNKEHE